MHKLRPEEIHNPYSLKLHSLSLLTLLIAFPV